MGLTFDSFCCSNEDREMTQSNINNHEGSIPSNDLPIKSSIFDKNDLQSNKVNKMIDNPFRDYLLIEFLGKGENSMTFMAKNKKNNEILAIKKLKRNKNANEEEIKSELDNLKKLKHAYINKIYDYYIEDDSIYLLEEFCSEGNLLDKIQNGKIFPEFIVKIIMFEIFKALIYLKSKNLVHGNLKIQNILIELNDIKTDEKTNKKNKNINIKEDKFIKGINKDMQLIDTNINKLGTYYKFDFNQSDSIKVMNKKINDNQKKSESAQMSSGLRFNISRKNDDKLRAIPNLKYKGENNIYNSGTFEFLKYGIKLDDYMSEKINFKNKLAKENILYSSPETIKENKSENCDIWACGIIMFLLLSGEYPFYGNDIDDIKSKITSGKFIFDFDKFLGVSEEAKDLIKKCLKINKELRITLLDTVKHPFFDDLKDSKVYLIDEKKILENLKNQKERPIFYQMVLSFISYHFKDTELLIELSRIFYKIDRDSDGKITIEDLMNAYEEAGEKVNKNELEEIIKLVDFDRNGFIEYDEFIRVCIPEDRLFTEDNLKDAFNLFDKNQNGNITYLNVVEALEREDRINSKMIALLKVEVSKMGDEILDFKKFYNLMVKLSFQ